MKRKKKTDRNKIVDIERERRNREIEAAIDKDYEEPAEISDRTAASIRRRRQQRRRRRLVYAVIILVILGITALLARNIVSLKIEENKLEAKKTQLEQKKKQLKKDSKTVQEPDYIEEQARKQLKMIKPGEILYVLPDENASNDGDSE